MNNYILQLAELLSMGHSTVRKELETCVADTENKILVPLGRGRQRQTGYIASSLSVRDTYEPRNASVTSLL